MMVVGKATDFFKNIMPHPSQPVMEDVSCCIRSPFQEIPQGSQILGWFMASKPIASFPHRDSPRHAGVLSGTAGKREEK